MRSLLYLAEFQASGRDCYLPGCIQEMKSSRKTLQTMVMRRMFGLVRRKRAAVRVMQAKLG